MLSFYIALHFIWNKRNNNGMVLSLITYVSIASMAIGVAILIIGLSAMNGFEYELKNRILSLIPHGEIEFVTPPIFTWSKLLREIQNTPGVHSAVPYIYCIGFIEHNNQLHTINLKGIEPHLEIKFNKYLNNIPPNQWLKFKNLSHQIIIGKGIADTLKIKNGCWLSILIPNYDIKTKLLLPQYIQVQICDIIEFHSQLDYYYAIIPLRNAQKYLQYNNNISGIAIKVNNMFHVNEIMNNIEKKLNINVYFHNWMQKYEYIFRDIQIIRIVIYLSMILVIITACFNIVSTLIALVQNKKVDIAILNTLGAENKLICAIFIWYGLLTGILGSIIGIIIGIGITMNLTELIKKIEYIFNYTILPDNIYFINFIPTQLYWIDIAIVLFIALSLNIITIWYPAKRASYMNPTRILNDQ